MNITTPYNQPKFGMAFEKPSKEVLEHFENTMKHMKPDERASFVKEMGAIVESAKNNPIPIEQGITKSNHPTYKARIENTTWTNDNNNAKAILDTMRSAVREADNLHDLRQNMKDIKKIFDIKA